MDNDEIFGSVIFKYTREDALKDGVLIDVSKAPATIEAGIKIPAAVTSAVFHVLDPGDELKRLGQSLEGRLWDMWTIFRLELRKKGSDVDEVHFAPLFLTNENHDSVPVKMWAKCGPGDSGEPVITVMMEGED